MQPLFFNESHNQLFGIYHEPEVYSRFSNHCVLICPPIGNEYMITHWAVRRMASCIARDGYHALRFDYAGTGDSHGEFTEFSVQHWVENILCAATELIDLSGNRKVILLGLRFGAVLAAMAAQRLKIEKLVLWEPICSGGTYLSELQNKHVNKIASSRVSTINRNYSMAGTEYLGFQYTSELINKLSQLDMLELIKASSVPVSVVSSSAGDNINTLLAALEASDRLTNQFTIHEGDNWLDKILSDEQVLVPNELVAAVIKALSLKLA